MLQRNSGQWNHQTGRQASAQTRERMSQAHKARGTRPPKAGRSWTADEDGLLRSGLPAAEVAARTGRTLGAVYSRRRELGLPGGRRGKTKPPV